MPVKDNSLSAPTNPPSVHISVGHSLVFTHSHSDPAIRRLPDLKCKAKYYFLTRNIGNYQQNSWLQLPAFILNALVPIPTA